MRRRRRHWFRLACARFVGKWEGFVSPPVLDTIANPPVWTGGFGHTSMAGAPKVVPGMVRSREFWEDVLARDLMDAIRDVEEKVKIKLTVRQKMAIVSARYNLGPAILEGSRFIVALNNGEIKRASNLLLEWSHAGGVVVEGLLNRRKAERWMMRHPLHPRNPHRPRPIPRHP